MPTRTRTGTHGFYGAAGATGIYAAAGMQGDVMVVNNGDVTALAIAEHSIGFVQGGAGATGIHAYAKYDATVDNTGDITAIAEAEFGITGAYGVIRRRQVQQPHRQCGRCQHRRVGFRR